MLGSGVYVLCHAHANVRVRDGQPGHGLLEDPAPQRRAGLRGRVRRARRPFQLGQVRLQPRDQQVPANGGRAGVHGAQQRLQFVRCPALDKLGGLGG